MNETVVRGFHSFTNVSRVKACTIPANENPLATSQFSLT